MAMSWSDWTNSINGKAVDIGPWGAQCYGLLQNYFNNLIGGQGQPSTQFGPDPGYAINVYDGYAQNGMAGYFTKLPANAKPQQGDVVFWEQGSSVAPESHVAIVNADYGGPDLQVWSQNSPQPYTILQDLPKAGIAGYLRPNVPIPGLGSVNGTSAVTTNSGGTNGTDPALWNLPIPLPPFNIPMPGNAPNIQDYGQAYADIGQAGINGLSGIVKGLEYIANFFNTADTWLTNGTVVKFLTGLMLPSTWIRMQAAFVGFILFITGIILIVLDYRKHQANES